MPAPLSNIRILSLAEQFPGPYATLLLADMGADVILVERPRGGDPSRAFPDFFKALGRNKRSICLDLKSEDGQRMFRELVRTADVVLEGFSPRTMKKLGLDYENLREVNPRLIYASITGFGHSGRHSNRAAHDISIQSISGMYASDVDSASDIRDFPLGDINGAIFCALGVLAALNGRTQTGQGTWIDVSMSDCLVSWLTFMLGPHANGGSQINVAQEPAYGTFACKDERQLTLSIAHEDYFWSSLCDVLAMDEEKKALTHGERINNAASLTNEIRSKIGGKDLSHWQQALDRAGVPWSELNQLGDVLANAHFSERDMFGKMLDHDKGWFKYVNQPLKFSEFSTGVKQPAPALGEHTDEILEELRARD